ncbi:MULTISPECIES: metal ABC transporter permease [Pseudanabaena]|jgi:manganese/iron transport system permease protein|uniref:metal ABC transporter permease n=1 Tax=Pseudanabaena TaxID=1152 RepID=UPI00247935C8|nr:MULTISPECIES: metal ABC transporter permease [Pseudanabaena]MEA5488973.1 metal ABC transporter permease [Pseudanabaena sp. CCNP1317]WGS73308.1 metal ABC transporter permease [Pseudanabaena galeata CCNP1313]
MLNWLIEPLGFEFMRNAIAIGILIGILSAVVGSYLIVQHMGLLGDVVAHAVLPGLAIAFYIGMDIFLGAFIAGTISTFVVAWIQTHSKIKVDTAMALVFSGFLALGVMLITTLKSKLDLHSFLFGDILGVTTADLWRTLIIAIAVLACVVIFYRELIFYCFDPLASKAMGLPVHFIHFGLMAGITLTIIASMQSVGVVLVVSLLTGPAATAYLLVKELHLMMALGALFGVIASVSGMYISYYQNVPSGSAIVLIISGLFLLALLFSPSQGILTKKAIVRRTKHLLHKLSQF